MPDQHPIHSEGPPQEDDASGASPKPMLSPEGQIARHPVRVPVAAHAELNRPCDRRQPLRSPARHLQRMVARSEDLVVAGRQPGAQRRPGTGG